MTLPWMSENGWVKIQIVFGSLILERGITAKNLKLFDQNPFLLFAFNTPEVRKARTNLEYVILREGFWDFYTARWANLIELLQSIIVGREEVFFFLIYSGRNFGNEGLRVVYKSK